MEFFVVFRELVDLCGLHLRPTLYNPRASRERTDSHLRSLCTLRLALFSPMDGIPMDSQGLHGAKRDCAPGAGVIPLLFDTVGLLRWARQLAAGRWICSGFAVVPAMARGRMPLLRATTNLSATRPGREAIPGRNCLLQSSQYSARHCGVL
jgi:hypothetical protein